MSDGIPTADGASKDAFDAWRESDEQHFLTFTTLIDLVDEEPVDLVVADSAWGVDHHFHENPELKRFAYAWLTDVVGWQPEDGADARRRALMHDANLEMVAQVDRYPRIRDASIFLRTLDDVPAVAFGPGLPSVRDWAAERMTMAGPIGSVNAAQRVVDRLMALLYAATASPAAPPSKSQG